MSPVVIPFAYSEMTLPSSPSRRRCPLRHGLRLEAARRGPAAPAARPCRSRSSPSSGATRCGCCRVRRPAVAAVIAEMVGHLDLQPVCSTWRTNAVNKPFSPVNSTPWSRASTTRSSANAANRTHELRTRRNLRTGIVKCHERDTPPPPTAIEGPHADSETQTTGQTRLIAACGFILWGYEFSACAAVETAAYIVQGRPGDAAVAAIGLLGGGATTAALKLGARTIVKATSTMARLPTRSSVRRTLRVCRSGRRLQLATSLE